MSDGGDGQVCSGAFFKHVPGYGDEKNEYSTCKVEERPRIFGFFILRSGHGVGFVPTYGTYVCR